MPRNIFIPISSVDTPPDNIFVGTYINTDYLVAIMPQEAGGAKSRLVFAGDIPLQYSPLDIHAIANKIASQF